jgi:crossover junction endodeoxyribonuclease RuvC
MSKIYIGIDPGVTGAAAFLTDGHAYVRDLPVLSVPNQSRRESVIDASTLWDWFGEAETTFECPSAGVTVVLEKTQAVRGGNGLNTQAKTAFSMGQSRGIIVAVTAIQGYGRIDVTPQRWKKHFSLIGCDKDASRTLAVERFPALRDVLKHKKHHNRAEALLLALWGKERNE